MDSSLNKTIICIISIAIILSFIFAGCVEKNNTYNNSDKEKFVGMWNTTEPIYWYIKPSFSFLTNGSFIVGLNGGTYNIVYDKLVLYWKDGESIFNYDYTFLDNNTVNITHIDSKTSGIYIRQ